MHTENRKIYESSPSNYKYYVIYVWGTAFKIAAILAKKEIL